MEQKLKLIFGDLILQIASLQDQNEQLQKRIEELERNLRPSDNSSL